MLHHCRNGRLHRLLPVLHRCSVAAQRFAVARGGGVAGGVLGQLGLHNCLFYGLFVLRGALKPLESFHMGPFAKLCLLSSAGIRL